MAAAVLCALAGPVGAQGGAPPQKTTFEVYGRVSVDFDLDFDQVDPLWYDVLRPTKLP